MNKKNKILPLILLIFVLFFICDFQFFEHYKKVNTKMIDWTKEYFPEDVLDAKKYFIRLVPFSRYKYEEQRSHIPIIQNSESKERSIVIYGDSFAHGYIAPDSETISYAMSKYTKRPIYNRSYPVWGIQHVLYQFQNEKEMFHYIKNPKYVFYVLSSGSLEFERLFLTAFPNILESDYVYAYKEKNEKLVERKPFLNIYYNFIIFRYIQNKLLSEKIKYKFNKNDKKLFNFFVLHFKEINNLLKTKWYNPNGEQPKFIVLTFENTKKENWAPQLQQEGIDVVDITELIGIENLEDKDKGFFINDVVNTPNSKLWNIIIPKLKELYPDL